MMNQDSIYELSTLIFNIIRSPPSSQLRRAPQQRRSEPITPAGFAAMLMGISMALMLCGSVTFFIGFLLMPWVLGFVVVLYFVGIFTSFFMVWRSVFGGCSFSAIDSIRKEASCILGGIRSGLSIRYEKRLLLGSSCSRVEVA